MPAISFSLACTLTHSPTLCVSHAHAHPPPFSLTHSHLIGFQGKSAGSWNDDFKEAASEGASTVTPLGGYILNKAFDK